MNIDLITDVIMLLAAIIGLLSSLFRYIETPKRGWLYIAVFFLADILSAYYWTAYTLAMQEEPDLSAFIAYLGWNIGYVVLLIIALHMRDYESRKFFSPLMLIPIPVNIVQLLLYNTFGGIFNNSWQVGFSTATLVVCLQSIIYYLKNRKNGASIPYLHILIFFYSLSEYCMWTISCFIWDVSITNPYYWFAIINYIIACFLAWGAGKEYEQYGLTYTEKSSAEIKLQSFLQVVIAGVVFAFCVGGYYLAGWIKANMPDGYGSMDMYTLLVNMLLIVSVLLIVVILVIVYFSRIKYRELVENRETSDTVKRNRFNQVFTTVVTLALMIFIVVYNSRLFYGVSVDSVYVTGEDEAENVSAELENYLTIAVSTLNVAADSVDLMIRNNESQDRIYEYLTDQTEKQFNNFDENFTGIYAYVRGEYMDGSGWIPPDDYDATSRDWYSSAIDAGGKAIIVSPYVDAQTNSVVITLCKYLPDSSDSKYHNVVALDVIVNHIQDVTEKADVGGKGYTMIVNSDGFIVAHPDTSLCGQYISDLFGEELLDMIIDSQNSTIETVIDDEDSTLFVGSVMDQWNVVIVVNDTELFEDAHSQLTVNIIVSLTIFVLISIFYYMGYKNEQAFGKKVEEMRVGRQKQEYEAEMLRLEKRSADEANKAKSSFLADMSHEIRTPINAILGMNEMILREADGANILEYAGNIRNSGKNLLSLINSILDFSKIEDGKMEIVPVRYSVKNLISYLYNSVIDRARSKKLSLIFDIDPMLPAELFGDDTRINQVILNLLTNAVKYTPEGSVTLTVRTKEILDGKVRIHVAVKDTGIGIRQSDMEKLFESFERLDVVRNRSIEGTGLGMSITTNLLELMDSKLDVDSEYGKGSVFSFEIWQGIENDEPVGEFTFDQADYDIKEHYHEEFRAPDAHILLVDDTKMNITVVVNLLKNTQINIDTALNGADAIDLANENVYDCILLDQRMPGMDGTQTLKRIREDDGLNASTPVICLTADAIRGAKERYIAEGFDDYLTKPIEGRELEQMLMVYIPDEKLIKGTVITKSADPVVEDKAEESKEESEKPILEVLEQLGLDTETGMEYCHDDESFYHMVLSQFAMEYADYKVKLEKYYEQKEWDDYSIVIHAVKSTSKLIGAGKLSGMALELEQAANNKDEALINEKHAETMSLYDNIALSIMDVLGDVDDDELMSSDSDVMEFAPVES